MLVEIEIKCTKLESVCKIKVVYNEKYCLYSSGFLCCKMI